MGIIGVVTEIERYSIHDGPGIRSVVFLKGCQFRCAWCCNPETLEPHVEMGFFPDKCIRCLKCISNCPYNAISLSDVGVLVANRDICATSCYGNTDTFPCTTECFSGARVAYGKRVTVAEVVREVEKDHQLYDRTGGGVTLSGGEISFQPEFVLALLRGLRDNWIDTAIETNGWGNSEFFERVADLADFIFLDIKSMNDRKHIEWTGVSNKQTLATAVLLSEFSRHDKFTLVIRTPVIPGFNESPDDLREIGEFIKTQLHNVPKWELLGYHRMGRGKYASLGKNYPMDGSSVLSVKRIHQLATISAKLKIKMVKF